MSRVLALVALTIVSFGCASSLQTRAENWLALSTRDLEIRTNFGPRTAEGMADDVQQLGSVVAKEFPCASANLDAKIHIAILRDDLAAGGEYKGPPTFIVDIPSRLMVRGRDPELLRQIFVHELSHRLLAACIPDAPPWVHEGIAGYYETAEITDGQLELGFPPYLFVDSIGDQQVRYVDVARFQGRRVVVMPPSRAPSFDSLVGMSAAEFYREKRPDDVTLTANYAGAWTLVHLLMFGDRDLQKRFAGYLRMLRAGSTPERAWAVNFRGVDVARLYRDRVSQGAADWYVKPVEVPPHDTVAVRAMSETDAAFLMAGLQRWDDATGIAAAEDWVDFASDNGANPITASLYEAALCNAVDDLECTRTKLDALFEGHPNDADVEAAIVMWTASRQQPQAAASKAAARLKTNATTPFQLAAAGLWFARAGAWQEALELADRALKLDAANWLARTIAGDCHANLGNLTEARKQYRAAIAFSSHASDEVRRQLVTALTNVEFLLSRNRSAAEQATP